MGVVKLKTDSPVKKLDLSLAFLFRSSIKEFAIYWKKYFGAALLPFLSWLMAFSMFYLTGLLALHWENNPSWFLFATVSLGLIMVSFFIFSAVISFCSTYAIIILFLDSTRTLNVLQAYKISLKMLFKLIVLQVFLTAVMILGALLLIIPALVFFIWFGLVYYIILDQRSGIFNALAESRYLVVGNWWRVLWLMAAGSFLFLVVPLLTINSIMVILDYWFTDQRILLGLNFFLKSVLSLIAVPVVVIFMGHVYRALKNHKPLIDDKQLAKNKKLAVFLVALGLPILIFSTIAISIATVNALKAQRQAISTGSARIYFEENEITNQYFEETELE